MTADTDRLPGIAMTDVALVDVLDRVLCGGVVLAGDVVIALADIDLVRISLRALVSSVETLEAT